MKKIIKRILIRLKERQEEESPSEKFSTNVFFSKHRFVCDDIGYKPYNPLIETHIL
jgi:hypothetical protein